MHQENQLSFLLSPLSSLRFAVLLACASALTFFGCEESNDNATRESLDRGELADRSPQLYPPEMISDQPERVLMGELIREQVLLHTREEVPHSVAVMIDRVELMPAKGKGAERTAVLATVLVERKSQKGILIGKGGAMLKTIGQGARLQMQTLIDGSVYLELFVKVVPDWRSKPQRLNELGYRDGEF